MSKTTPDHWLGRSYFNCYILEMARDQLVSWLAAHDNAGDEYETFRKQKQAEIDAINVRIKQWKNRNE